MRINTTLVINPKGGSGKTTVAINLASYFAADNIPVTLMDYDPQGSSLNWLRSRAPTRRASTSRTALRAGMGNCAASTCSCPRTPSSSSSMRPPAHPACWCKKCSSAHSIVVPVVPSVIDIHATSNFIREIMGVGRVRSGDIRVAVANKVRLSMPAYQPFLRFLIRLISSSWPAFSIPTFI